MVKVVNEGSGADAPEDDYSENGQPQTEPTWEALFDAPDYTSLVRPNTSRVAKEYETNTNSILKAVLIASINAGDFPDAAAILERGPAFSAATGQLAASNDTARKAIDLLTSPASPTAMFLLSAIGLSAQLIRNHEPQIREIPGAVKQSRAERKAQKAQGVKPEPRFTIKIGNRIKIPVRFNVRPSRLFAPFRAQTKDPQILAAMVFGNEDLQRALEKQGIIIVRKEQ